MKSLKYLSVPILCLCGQSLMAQGLFNTSRVSMESATTQPTEGVMRSRQVSLNVTQLQKLLTHAESTNNEMLEIQLNLFEDIDVSASLNQDNPQLPFLSNNANISSFSGTLKGDRMSLVTLTKSPSGLMGTIASREGTYRVVPLQNGEHRIDHIDTSAMVILDDEVVSFESRNFETATSVKPKPGEPIDIMAIFSRESINEIRTYLNTQAIDHTMLANMHTAKLNQSFELSSITSAGTDAFRLVHSEEIDFPFKDANQILDGLEKGVISGDRRVNQMREKYGADLVIVYVSNPNPGHTLPKGTTFCGRAGGIPNSGIFQPSRGFTVVNIICSFLNDTVSHEVGHMIGGQHDPDAHGGKIQISGTNRGYVDYTNRLRTIMSYDQGCHSKNMECAEIPVFSNPNLTLTSKSNNFKWIPGMPNNDNASFMKQNLAYIAGYRERADSKPTVAPTPQPAPARNPATSPPAPTVAPGPTANPTTTTPAVQPPQTTPTQPNPLPARPQPSPAPPPPSAPPEDKEPSWVPIT